MWENHRESLAGNNAFVSILGWQLDGALDATAVPTAPNWFSTFGVGSNRTAAVTIGSEQQAFESTYCLHTWRSYDQRMGFNGNNGQNRSICADAFVLGLRKLRPAQARVKRHTLGNKRRKEAKIGSCT